MEKSEIFEAIQTCNDDTPSKCLKAIQNGDDVNSINESGENYLHVIGNKYSGENDAPYLIPVVFQLSTAGIRKNNKNHEGETALHVAVKKYGVQKLVRALIMIGVDPKSNNSKGVDIKEIMNKDDTETNTCVELLYPGLWNAVELGQDETVLRLSGSWCNIEETREGKSVLNLIHLNLSEKTANLVEKSLPTKNLVYAALSRDKKMLKKALKDKNCDINTKNASFVGLEGSVFFMPLVGEVALLHSSSCLEKLLKAGADINVVVDETGSADPLFSYLLKALPSTEDAYDVLEILLPYANFSLCEDKTPLVCRFAFEKHLPFALVKTMISKGLNLFERDENGYNLRDKIYLNNYLEGKESLRYRLGFVDQILVDMAIEGDMEMLERLCINSYDYDQVQSKQGLSIMEAVAEKGKPQVVKFLEGLPELQRTVRRVNVAIENGNLHEIKQHMIKRLAESCDKGGRGLLHKAVQYERRYTIKYFLKEYPQMVQIKDSVIRRTPLHWAVSLKEGQDIVDILKSNDGDMMARDKRGRTPADYQNISEAMQEVIQKERTRGYGIEVYLLQRYMEFKFAIESGSLSKVEETRNAMYKDITLDDVHVKMHQTKPPPKDLLSLCIDHQQDKIGKYLLSQGMHWDGTYIDGNIKISMEEAAEKYKMTNTLEAIHYLKSREAEEKRVVTKVKIEKKELIEKQKKTGIYDNYPLQTAINGKQNNNSRKNNQNVNDKDNATKSCSCTLL